MKPYSFLQEIYLGEFPERKTKYLVHIMPDDSGNKFHFHVLDYANEGGKFHTCVELFDNRYYWHEGKTDVFNTKQRSQLDEFLRKPYTGKRRFIDQKWSIINNWQALCHLWNETNAIKIDSSLIYNLRKQPSYIYIKPNQFKIPKRHH